MPKWTTFLRRRVEVTIRMVVLLTLAMLIVTLGTAFNLKAQQLAAHQRCVETQERARATAPAIAKLVEAHRLDGDPHATAVWQEYLDAARKNPAPSC